MLTRRFFLRCLTAAAAATTLPILSPSRSAAASLYTETRLMMGTFVTIKTSGLSEYQASDAMGRAFEHMSMLEEALTRFSGSSPLGQLNAAGFLHDAPEELLAVLHAAADIHRLTGGFFDPTVLPLLEVLELNTSRPLDDKERAEASELIGMSHVDMTRRNIRFNRSGMKISLDGIAKGYIADEGARVLKAFGVQNFLINAGGDIIARGGKAGDPWRIAVENPEKYHGNTAYPATISLHDQAIASSGPYERTLNTEGTLNHIVNPVTGQCASLPGASVIATSAMEADALATALCILNHPVDFMEKVPGTACLIIMPGGRTQQSRLWG